MIKAEILKVCCRLLPQVVACLLLVSPVSEPWAMSLQEIELAQKEALAPVLEPAQRTQLEQLYT